DFHRAKYDISAGATNSKSLCAYFTAKGDRPRAAAPLHISEKFLSAGGAGRAPSRAQRRSLHLAGVRARLGCSVTGPAIFAYRFLKYSCTKATAMAPSPTAEVTRFIELERTS